LGAVEDGSVKVSIVARVIFQRRNPRPTRLVGRRGGRERGDVHRGTRHLTAAEPTPNTTEDVLGAVEDGSVKVFIVARVIFQRRNPRP
jgi:hypothetical protein